MLHDKCFYITFYILILIFGLIFFLRNYTITYIHLIISSNVCDFKTVRQYLSQQSKLVKYSFNPPIALTLL